MEQHRLFPMTLIAVTFVFALNAMFGQLYRSGWVATALKLLNSEASLLPGTETHLLKTYIGIAWFDKLLALANLFFADVANGSSPELILYAVQFGGQLVPIFMIMIVEALRAGNRGNIFYQYVTLGIQPGATADEVLNGPTARLFGAALRSCTATGPSCAYTPAFICGSSHLRGR